MVKNVTYFSKQLPEYTYVTPPQIRNLHLIAKKWFKLKRMTKLEYKFKKKEKENQNSVIEIRFGNNIRVFEQFYL